MGKCCTRSPLVLILPISEERTLILHTRVPLTNHQAVVSLKWRVWSPLRGNAHVVGQPPSLAVSLLLVQAVSCLLLHRATSSHPLPFLSWGKQAVDEGRGVCWAHGFWAPEGLLDAESRSRLERCSPAPACRHISCCSQMKPVEDKCTARDRERWARGKHYKSSLANAASQVWWVQTHRRACKLQAGNPWRGVGGNNSDRSEELTQ